MSKTGQNNNKGVNFQIWISISLFLQFLKDPKFSHLQLEGADLEDLTLYFNDGTKILGEAKIHKRKVQPALLKDILNNIVARKTFNTGDKILVACTSVSEDLWSNIKSLRYFDDAREKFKKEHKYSYECIDLLQYVDFWIVEPEVNKDFVRSLIADLLVAWIPNERLEEFVNTLVENLRVLSEKGGIYYRADFFDEVNNLKTKVISDASYYNPQLDDMEAQYDHLEDSLKGTTTKDRKLAVSAISALSTNPGLLDFARRQLEAKIIDQLRAWNALWQMNRVRYFSYGIFDIFVKNTHTKDNRNYIVEYCKQFVGGIRGYYQNDYFSNNVVRVLLKVLEIAPKKERESYFDDIFKILQELLTSKREEIFYLKKVDHERWEKEEACKLLKELYDQGDKSLKAKIVALIWTTFNLTEDDDELARRVPSSIYEIIANWLEKDFTKNFNLFVKKINKQYHDYYGRFNKKRKNIYDGWQHIGGGTAFWGSNYHIRDKYFITTILQKIIETRYSENQKATWKFIASKCIAKEGEVSEAKPDFLNRSVYEIVLKRYINGTAVESAEAFDILKEFLLQKRGIPHKSEMIYQWVAGNSSLIPKDKKIELIKVRLEKYKIPSSPFVEQIVKDLALSGNSEAKNEILSWFKDENYYERGHFGGNVGISIIDSFTDKDLDFAVELLDSFTSSRFFIDDKLDIFETYQIARLITKISIKDSAKGIVILNTLVHTKNWSRNQRSIFCFGLFDQQEKELMTQAILRDIYSQVVDPFLSSFNNDAAKIAVHIPEGGFRSAIVQFADKLAEYDLTKEAVRIVSVFVDDPHPYLPKESPDLEDEAYNEHKRILETGDRNPSITSVRGWCGWVIMRCSFLSGREQIPTLVSLTKKLIKDKNYYVIHMACFGLAQLAQVRLTYIDETQTELFLDRNPEKARKKAREIEDISFTLLKRIIKLPEENARKVLGHSVLQVFDQIKSLNRIEAEQFLGLITKLPMDVQADASSFFIYYAFFRKQSYLNMKFTYPSLYDDINSTTYNYTLFEDLLEKHIKDIQSADPDNCFKVVSNIEKIMKESLPVEKKALEIKSYKFLSLVADAYGHNISNYLYKTIISKFPDNTIGFEKWYKLLKKAFQTEAEFYKSKNLLGSTLPSEVAQNHYWYPSMYNSEILMKVKEFGGEKKFIEIIKIILTFPLGFELNLTSEPLKVLIEMATGGHKEAKTLLTKLYKSDPGKWRWMKGSI